MPTVVFAPEDLFFGSRITVTRSPFAPGRSIVKRIPYPRGTTPPHLIPYAIRPGECAGRTGTVIGPRGNPIPATAQCVAEKHGKAAAPRRRRVTAPAV